MFEIANNSKKLQNRTMDYLSLYVKTGKENVEKHVASYTAGVNWYASSNAAYVVVCI